MDNANLWLAVRARAVADTTSGGLFAQNTPLLNGIYPNLAPYSAVKPFVVFDVASVAPEHGFNKDVFEALVRFNVYVPMEDQIIGDTAGRCSDIITRLYGNWSSASPSTAPTYGFHRHKLVLTSGNFTGGYMMKSGALAEHEPGMWHYIEEYRLVLSR